MATSYILGGSNADKDAKGLGLVKKPLPEGAKPVSGMASSIASLVHQTPESIVISVPESPAIQDLRTQISELQGKIETMDAATARNALIKLHTTLQGGLSQMSNSFGGNLTAARMQFNGIINKEAMDTAGARDEDVEEVVTPSAKSRASVRQPVNDTVEDEELHVTTNERRESGRDGARENPPRRGAAVQNQASRRLPAEGEIRTRRLRDDDVDDNDEGDHHRTQAEYEDDVGRRNNRSVNNRRGSEAQDSMRRSSDSYRDYDDEDLDPSYKPILRGLSKSQTRPVQAPPRRPKSKLAKKSSSSLPKPRYAAAAPLNTDEDYVSDETEDYGGNNPPIEQRRVPPKATTASSCKRFCCIVVTVVLCLTFLAAAGWMAYLSWYHFGAMMGNHAFTPASNTVMGRESDRSGPTPPSTTIAYSSPDLHLVVYISRLCVVPLADVCLNCTITSDSVQGNMEWYAKRDEKMTTAFAVVGSYKTHVALSQNLDLGTWLLRYAPEASSTEIVPTSGTDGTGFKDDIRLEKEFSYAQAIWCGIHTLDLDDCHRVRRDILNVSLNSANLNSLQRDCFATLHTSTAWNRLRSGVRPLAGTQLSKESRLAMLYVTHSYAMSSVACLGPDFSQRYSLLSGKIRDADMTSVHQALRLV